ncbi:MAG: radical SAM protein [Patescibacteria group bacterium]
MDLYQKISVLGPSARYDTCGPKDFGNTTNIPGVYHAKVGGKDVCRLFKVLQSNACQNNCRYCAFRRDRSCQRVSVSPDEMAQAFVSAHSRRLVDGLFLSSGIVKDPDSTMSQMIDTAEILRKKYQYRGYVHLKMMPGTSLPAIRQTIRVANRVSLNIESPSESGLLELSEGKSLAKGFYHTLSLIKAELNRLRWAGAKTPSLTTQFVVGAGQETDSEIVKTTHFLYKNFGLARVFYSAFQPVAQTPLADRPAVLPVRAHRLYQADFLMRFYRFSPWDIPLNTDGFLPELTDPKTLWAQQHPEFFPVNINRADYWTLLKVPGLGPTSAKKIIQLRNGRRIRFLTSLASQRIQVKKMTPFVCC